ncbi:MAG: hypothetical protein KF761_07970 [Salinibacterium sp.]|nr:hypothetical protein [Salinibacterium sp.]
MRTLFSTRRTLVIVLAVTAVLLALMAIGVIGLLLGGGHTPAPTSPATRAPAARTPPGTASVRPSMDAVLFGRRVAAVLFDWDTTTPGGTAAILDALVAVGDPSGEDVPGLYADAAGYLPTAAQWEQLAEYATTQRLVIDTATIPESWSGIVGDPANPLPAGTTAVTVEGTRVRAGEWFGQTTRKQFPVAFTMFLSCPPATDRPSTPNSSTEDSCRLLRLSILGEPLR